MKLVKLFSNFRKRSKKIGKKAAVYRSGSFFFFRQYRLGKEWHAHAKRFARALIFAFKKAFIP